MTDDIDFNSADTQDVFDIIPADTLARVALTIRPGGAGPDGWVTQSRISTALYLNTEAIILAGPYKQRRIYTRIGLRGKSVNESGEDNYANRGKALIRGILESARGIKFSDQSETARTARKIRSLGELNGLEFAARIGIEKDRRSSDDGGRNVIKAAIGPDHAQYIKVMGETASPVTMPASPAAPAPHSGNGACPDASAPGSGDTPFWEV